MKHCEISRNPSRTISRRPDLYFRAGTYQLEIISARAKKSLEHLQTLIVLHTMQSDDCYAQIFGHMRLSVSLFTREQWSSRRRLRAQMPGANAFKGQTTEGSTKFCFWQRKLCGTAHRLRKISNICCVAYGV